MVRGSYGGSEPNLVTLSSSNYVALIGLSKEKTKLQPLLVINYIISLIYISLVLEWKITEYDLHL